MSMPDNSNLPADIIVPPASPDQIPVHDQPIEPIEWNDPEVTSDQDNDPDLLDNPPVAG